MFAELALAVGLALGEPEAAAPARVVVSVSTLPDQDFDERVVAAVLAHTRARGIPIEVLRPADLPTPAVLAREGQEMVVRWGARGAVWIDLEPDGTSTLYLAEPTRDRVYRRTLPAVGAGSAQAESVANVVSAVIAAILEGQLAIGEAPAGLDVVEPILEVAEPVPVVDPRPEPAAPEPAAPEPAAPEPAASAAAPRPAPRSWPRLRLAVGYAGTAFAAALPWQSGVALAAGWRPAPRVHLDLGYELMFGSRVRSEPIDLLILRHPISVAGGYSWPVGRRWDLRLGGRFTVDIVARRVERGAPGLTFTDDRLRLFTSAGVGIGAGVRPTAAVRIGLTVGVEAVFQRTDYAIYTPARSVVLAPFPVRAVAAMAVEFELVRRARGPK